MFFKLPGSLAVVGAMLNECLSGRPCHAVEELLEGLRHLHAGVVLVDAVQLLEDSLKPVLLVRGGLGQVLHLLPDGSRQAGEEVDGGLRLLAVEGHLLVIQVHTLPVLAVAGRLPIEDGYVVVADDLRCGRRRSPSRPARGGARPLSGLPVSTHGRRQRRRRGCFVRSPSWKRSAGAPLPT